MVPALASLLSLTVTPSRNGQRRLALLGAAVEDVTVQVKRDVGRGDRYVLLRVRQQLHCCIARRSADCFLQAGIALAVDFCDPGLAAIFASYRFNALFASRCCGDCCLVNCSCGGCVFVQRCRRAICVGLRGRRGVRVCVRIGAFGLAERLSRSVDDGASDVVSSSAANAALGTIMGHIATLIKTEMTLFALLAFIFLSVFLDSNSCYISIPAVTAFSGK